jgi:hypothetical protein
MAERQIRKEGLGAGEAHPPPMTAVQFENAPEFRRFKTGMRELLKVSKPELDRRIEHSKKASPRAGNPNAPGRKSKSAR